MKKIIAVILILGIVLAGSSTVKYGNKAKNDPGGGGMGIITAQNDPGGGGMGIIRL